MQMSVGGNFPSVSESVAAVDRALISWGIGSASRSRTNKLSPNTGSAWRWWLVGRGGFNECMCCWGWGGHAYIKQRRLVNIRVWRINTIYFFLRRRGLCSTHHSTGWRTGASPEVKNRHVPSVAFAGKDGVQILYDGGKGGGCKRHAAVEHQK